MGQKHANCWWQPCILFSATEMYYAWIDLARRQLYNRCCEARALFVRLLTNWYKVSNKWIVEWQICKNDVFFLLNTIGFKVPMFEVTLSTMNFAAWMFE